MTTAGAIPRRACGSRRTTTGTLSAIASMRTVGQPCSGQSGSPRLFFFNTLERTAECCSSWRFPDVRETGVLAPSEKPIERNDHLPDCLRYIATSFPEPSIAEKVRREPTAADWQI